MSNSTWQGIRYYDLEVPISGSKPIDYRILASTTANSRARAIEKFKVLHPWMKESNYNGRWRVTEQEK